MKITTNDALTIAREKTKVVPAKSAPADAINRRSLRNVVDSLLYNLNFRLTKYNCKYMESTLKRGQLLLPQDPEILASQALCYALGKRKFLSAVKLAKRAVEAAPFHPSGYYALGRISLMGGRRFQAYRNLSKARRLAGNDERLHLVLDELEERQPPVLPFLSRNHGLNVWLGKTRYNLANDRHLALVALLGCVGLVWLIFIIRRGQF